MTADMSRSRINPGAPAPVSRVRINLGPNHTGPALRPFAEYLREVAGDLDAGRPVDVAALRSAVDDLEGTLQRRAEAGIPQAQPDRS